MLANVYAPRTLWDELIHIRPEVLLEYPAHRTARLPLRTVLSIELSEPLMRFPASGVLIDRDTLEVGLRSVLLTRVYYCYKESIDNPPQYACICILSSFNLWNLVICVSCCLLYTKTSMYSSFKNVF